LGVTEAVIWLPLTTLVLETGADKTVGDRRPLLLVVTLTVLTGQPVAADKADVMKPVPVMVMFGDCPVNHTLGEIEVMVGMEQTETGNGTTVP
jgi:hypothetical protein